jgi:hypothetical protein
MMWLTGRGKRNLLTEKLASSEMKNFGCVYRDAPILFADAMGPP